ncbi:hypothetical protein ACWEBX_39000, partial [Streptomyces sp. NPDC005070]
MRESREVHDELCVRLREAAGSHEPDRARILARVERGMAGSGRRAGALGCGARGLSATASTR